VAQTPFEVLEQEYRLPRGVLLKIATIESNVNPKAPMRVNKNGTKDVGMFQINSVHWHTTCKAFNVFELSGNARCAALLVARHRTKAGVDEHWVARYHSKTPRYKLIYARKLEMLASN
jgi:hypothetical protein